MSKIWTTNIFFTLESIDENLFVFDEIRYLNL